MTSSRSRAAKGRNKGTSDRTAQTPKRTNQQSTARAQQLPAIAQKVTRSSTRLAARTQPDQPRQKTVTAVHEQILQSTSKNNLFSFISASVLAKQLSVADIRKPGTTSLNAPEQGGYDDRGFWQEPPSPAVHRNSPKQRPTETAPVSTIVVLIFFTFPTTHRYNHFSSKQGYTPSSKVIGDLFRTKSVGPPPQSLSHVDVFQHPNNVTAYQEANIFPFSSSTQTADTSEIVHQVEELSDEDEQSPIKSPTSRRSRVRPVESKSYTISDDGGEGERHKEGREEDGGCWQPIQPLSLAQSRSIPLSNKWHDPFSYIPAANTQSAAPLRSYRRNQIRPSSTVLDTPGERVGDEEPTSQTKFDCIEKMSETPLCNASSIVKATSISGNITYGKGRSHTYKAGLPDPVRNGQLTSLTPLAHSFSTHNPSAIGLPRKGNARDVIGVQESLNKAPTCPVGDHTEEGEDELWSDDWPVDLEESPTKRGPLRPVTMVLGKRSPRKHVAKSDNGFNYDTNIHSQKKRRIELPNEAASSLAHDSPRLRLSRNESVQIRVQNYIQVVHSVRPKRSRRNASGHIRPPAGYSFKPFEPIPFSEYVEEYRKNPNITLFQMPTGLFSSGYFARRHASKKIIGRITRHKTPPALDPSQNDPHWEDEIVFESSTRPLQPRCKDRSEAEASAKRIPRLNVIADPDRHQSQFQLLPGQLSQRKQQHLVEDACRKVPISDSMAHRDTGRQTNTSPMKTAYEEMKCEKVEFPSLLALPPRRTVVKDTGYWKIPQQGQLAKRINPPKKSVWPVQLRRQESIEQFPSPAFVSINLSLSISGNSTQERQPLASQCLNAEDDFADRRMMSGIDMTNHLVGRLNSHSVQSRKKRQEEREKRVQERREALRKEKKKDTDAGVNEAVQRPSQKVSVPVTLNQSHASIPLSHAKSSDTQGTKRSCRAVATPGLSRDLVRSSTQVRPLSEHPTPCRISLLGRKTMLPSPSFKMDHTITELGPVRPQPSNIVATPSKVCALLTQLNTQHNTGTSFNTQSYPPLAQASRHLDTQCTQVLERTEVDSSRTRPTLNLERTEVDSSSQPCFTQGLEKTWIGSSRPQFRAFSFGTENEEAHETKDALFSQGTPELSPSPAPATQALSRLRSRSIGRRPIGLRAPPSTQKTPVSQQTKSQGTQKSGVYSQFRSPLKKTSGTPRRTDKWD
ncbi:uncharacterized protein IAS62_001087 [Cryptococcus decagattii]|uniref:Uncharacterized protein n=1 Tax=Cryptococcus decagattii TaxID=1859122 RepID=A0ABZ2AN61_9TREE